VYLIAVVSWRLSTTGLPERYPPARYCPPLTERIATVLNRNEIRQDKTFRMLAEGILARASPGRRILFMEWWRATGARWAARSAW
jgi:hypothetical protein